MKVLLLRFVNSSFNVPQIVAVDSINALYLSKDCLEFDVLPKSEEFKLIMGNKPFWELASSGVRCLINYHIMGKMCSLQSTSFLQFSSIIVMNDSESEIELILRGDLNTSIINVVPGASFSSETEDLIGTMELEGSDFCSYSERHEYSKWLADNCDLLTTRQLNSSIVSLLTFSLGKLNHITARNVVQSMYNILSTNLKISFTRDMFSLELLEQKTIIGDDFPLVEVLNSRNLGA